MNNSSNAIVGVDLKHYEALQKRVAILEKQLAACIEGFEGHFGAEFKDSPLAKTLDDLAASSGEYAKGEETMVAMLIFS
jgi:hypothetical protein